MKRLLLALQFLTIIPIRLRNIDVGDLPNSTIYFPLVGLLLGLILVGINKLLLILGFGQFIINILLVISLILLTGGLHLDGLSDTADALLSGKPKDKMLEIMRDPHIGVMGVLSITSIMLLKIGFLAAVAIPLKTTALLLMCVLSRWSAVLAMGLFDYARQEGKAKMFMQGMNLKIFVFSLIAVLIFAFAIWRLKGLFTLLIVAGCTYLGGRFANEKIGGITGDTLGATIEVAEIITLFTVCIS